MFKSQNQVIFKHTYQLKNSIKINIIPIMHIVYSKYIKLVFELKVIMIKYLSTVLKVIDLFVQSKK